MKILKLYLAATAILTFNLATFNSTAQTHKLWGMTSHGGQYGTGVIFETDSSGNNETVQKSFFLYKGDNPQYSNLIQASDGNLYGITSNGGANYEGVLFQYNPSTNSYADLFDFNQTNGSNPTGSLIQASDGNLYGMTSAGGANGDGVLFQYNLSTNTYTKMLDFAGTTNGSTPYGSLMQASDKNLYGMTYGGGANGYGVLFQYNLSTNTYTKELDFAGATNGSYPYGSLIQANNGNLYGMTYQGGANGLGVLFQYNASTNAYTKELDFAGTTNGSNPYGSLMQASDGNLYGMTYGGGANNDGVLFQYNPSANTYTKKLDFAGTTNGSNPYGSLIQASDGNLYGMTYGGGANNNGVFFQYNPSTNNYTKESDFAGTTNGSYPYGSLMQASDGNLYGMTYGGGVNSQGVLFQYDPSANLYTKELDFGYAPNGSFPYSSLIQASDGNLYGMTYGGGANNDGVLFQYNPSTNTYTKELDFDGTTNGRNPYGSLMQASDGNLYGMTYGGGANNQGVLFQYNPSTNTYTKELDFAGATNGSFPYGSLVQASDGNLYGMTYEGGANGLGVLFQYNPSTNTFTKELDFAGTINGSYPQGSLIQASNGNLYGMTAQGGANGDGVLFEYNPSTNAYTKELDFAGTTNGSFPNASLIQASDGNLYGMTSQGGANNDGVLFQYNPSTNAYTKKLDFAGTTNGNSPGGSLMQARNGNLYGMTLEGGANNLGVLFQYNPSTNTFTKTLDYNGTNGEDPYYGNLIEIVVTVSTTSISTSAVNTNDCVGSSISVPYNIAGTYNNGNVFTAQLSNASGSFASPVNIGTFTSVATGTINATIPVNAVAGTGYRIRVVSSSPVVTGTDNGSNITVNTLPTATITPGSTTSICQGTSAMLTASSGSSYLWSNNSTTQSISVSAAGNYSVTVTGANGCSATSPATSIAVNSLPTATITPNGTTSICQGTSTTLTASVGSSYLWSNNSTTQSISVSGAGDYSVTVTGANGCSASSPTTSIVVNSLPTATITPGGITSICQGTSTTLTASSGSSYLWSNNATTQSISVSAAGNYSVTVTGANGCSATSPATSIAVNSLPTATITPIGITSICQGTSTTLTASSGSSYLWSNNATTQSISVSGAGNYSVTVTGANGCSATSPATSIAVNSLPTATITPSGTTSICQGTSATLTASSGSSYLWSNNATTQSISVSGAGNYSVTVTGANGCSATSPATSIAVNTLPTATITPSGTTSICQGTSTTLTASSGSSYLWSNNSTTQSISVSGAGNHSVTVTGDNGCSATSPTTSIAVNSLPTATITPSGTTSICQGTSTTLTASVGSSYLWSNNSTTQSISVSGAGNYSVTVTGANGCSATSPATSIAVNSLPTATITPSGTTSICQGTSATLTASSGSSYLWSNNATTQSISVSAAGNYSVTVTGANGCSATSPATSIAVNSLPTATITPIGTTSICQGTSTTLTASSGSSYLWSNNSTTQSISVSGAGDYSVTVTGANGCSASSPTTSVVVNSLPMANITPGGITTINQGTSITLTTGVGSSYLWSNNSTTQSISVSAAGDYSVTVTGANGCSATSLAISIDVIPIISVNGTTLISSSITGNQWYLNGNIIPNATSQTYTVSQNGNYTVRVTFGNGESSISEPYDVTTFITGITEYNQPTIEVYPNPSSGIINVNIGQIENVQVNVHNILGESIYQHSITSSIFEINLSEQPAGVYVIKIITKKGLFIKNIVISH